jgi:hypothetical protein
MTSTVGYSPSFGEGVFSEVRRYGVLGSTPACQSAAQQLPDCGAVGLWATQPCSPSACSPRGGSTSNK